MPSFACKITSRRAWVEGLLGTIARKIGTDDLIGRCFQGQDGQMPGRQAFLEEHQAKAADRRRIDQYLRQHDESDRQQQQPSLVPSGE